MLSVYHAAGLLEDRGIIFGVDEPFEFWDCDDNTFDAIVTTNALDHGEMGFYLFPKIWRLLKPGGRLFLHVNLRQQHELNLLHDHCLTLEQLDQALCDTRLRELHRKMLPLDIDGIGFNSIVGVWEK